MHPPSRARLYFPGALQTYASPALLTLEGKTVTHNGRVWSFVGDTLGWFYSSVGDIHHQESDTINHWLPQFNLSSEARRRSTVSLSHSLIIATGIFHCCISHNMRVGHLFPDSSLD